MTLAQSATDNDTMLNSIKAKWAISNVLNISLIFALMLYPSISKANADVPKVGIIPKVIEGFVTVAGIVGAVSGSVDLFCKQWKGKKWLPSMCKESKVAEKLSEMTSSELQLFLESFVRKLPTDKKKEFLKALYADLSDEAKNRLQEILSKDELDFLSVQILEKTVKSVAAKIISKKMFTLQLIYCDTAKQAACNGKINPMGSIKCGTNYHGRYEHIVHSFEFTGTIRETGQNQTKAYSNANIEEGKLSLWGRILVFDPDGDVFDDDCGRVGKLVFDS